MSMMSEDKSVVMVFIQKSFYVADQQAACNIVCLQARKHATVQFQLHGCVAANSVSTLNALAGCYVILHMQLFFVL